MRGLVQRYRPSGAPKVRAIPAGGTWKQGRDRAFCLAFLILATPALAEDASPVNVPSGQAISFFDLVSEDQAKGTLRFRFLAPELGRDGRDFHEITEDFPHLCETFALPHLATQGLSAEKIVISLMQAPVEFGVMTPDVTQFFESFSIDNDRCIWEAF